MSAREDILSNIRRSLGVNGRDFTPADDGKAYTVTPILKPVDHLRDDFTLIRPQTHPLGWSRR